MHLHPPKGVRQGICEYGKGLCQDYYVSVGEVTLDCYLLSPSTIMRIELFAKVERCYYMDKDKKSSDLKLHSDGNGGIYFDPDDVLNDPEIQQQAQEFSSVLREMTREKNSTDDSGKDTDK